MISILYFNIYILLSIFPHYHHSEILYTKLISVYIRNISWSQLCCLVLYTF